MATSSIFNAIAPEALTNDNYPNWSSCVENYLLGQDLWDIVETESKPTENEATWRKRNAMALHAIQISCGPDILSRIRKIKSAKKAWESLAKMHKTKKVDEPTKPLGDPETETIVRFNYAPLLNAVATGDWNCFELHRNEYVLEATVSSDGTTVLHHAVIKGHVKIVEELVQLMSKVGLKIKDNRGRTALHYAITCGFYKMVACMVQKDEELLSIADKKGVIPVVSACQRGNKDMTRYLYSLTPLKDLTSQNGINGATLLCYCMTSNTFDVALDLLRKCPRLAFASDAKGGTLVSFLSQMPSAFHSGSQLLFTPSAFNSGSQLLFSELRIIAFINSCIYSCIRVASTPPSRQYTPPSNDTRIDIPRQCQPQTNRGSIVTQELGQLCWSLSNILLKLLGIKQIYDTKLIHTQASQLLDVICEEIPNLSPTGHEMDDLVRDALFSAVKHGIVEFVKKITKAAPYLLSIVDADNRSIFHCAIVSRQQNILSLVYKVDSVRAAELTTLEDEFGNNMLHLAGMLAPSTRLHRIPGAAFQMQRELQWFKEVENIVPSKCKEIRLEWNGHTPRELFTEEHRELVKEGQKWMKETSTSCALVAALIATIMFTAAFTVPGGNHQDTGFPMLLDNKLFKVFILCDAISFLSATTSILIFMGILTSRYAEEDFLKSLPTKMILGLTTLFISIATMITAFCATLSLMLQGQMWGTFILVLVLASMPILVFVLLQFPLLVEISISTYGRSIFDRKTKCWYK